MQAGMMRLERMLEADSLCLQRVHAPHQSQPETILVLQDGVWCRPGWATTVTYLTPAPAPPLVFLYSQLHTTIS
jgi:hypothetical protein